MPIRCCDQLGAAGDGGAAEHESPLQYLGRVGPMHKTYVYVERHARGPVHDPSVNDSAVAAVRPHGMKGCLWRVGGNGGNGGHGGNVANG